MSAASVAGTLSSSNAIGNGGSGAGGGVCRRHKSKRRKDSRASVLSKQSGNSVRSRASALAARAGLHMTASFLRKKRKEYEGEWVVKVVWVPAKYRGVIIYFIFETYHLKL